MNIEERRNAILQSLDAMRFGIVKHTKEELNETHEKFMKFDWGKLTKPPLSYYIPQQGIISLDQLATDVKLMNNPVKRFKIMNDILKQYRFFPLASGTNRRAFYNSEDPSIILKVGSDRVGKSDNTSEFYLQNTLKPFCPKIYDIAPSGVCMLSERVEPMTEKEFKLNWSGFIFDFILSLMYRGYMMEDIGGNFYKNWGTRMGFGPVMLDFPYIYEVDWSRLKCSFVDPFTHIQCDGYLDYDYSKGMSEIVCDKCGTRYSAKYLAKNIPSSAFVPIIKGRKITMDTNFKVTIRRGKDVVYRSYSESGAASNQFRDVVHTSPREEKPQIHQQTQSNNNATRGSVHSPLRNELVDDVNDFLIHMEKKHGKGAAIDIARRLGIYYQSPNDKSVNNARQPQSKPLNKPTTTAPKKEEGPSEKKVNIVSDRNPNLQTTNLYPVKPKTQEEIDAEEELTRSEGAVMGFPGESMVNTMKIKQQIPDIRQMVYNAFNNFGFSGDDFTKIDYLNENTRQIITPSIERLIGDTNGLEVSTNISVDHMNKTCYIINVSSYKSPLFEVTVYPKDDSNGEETNKGSREIASGINLLENTSDDNGIVTSVADPSILFGPNDPMEEEPPEKDDDLQEDKYVKGMDLTDFFTEQLKTYNLKDIHGTDEYVKQLVFRRLLSDAMDIKEVPYAKATKSVMEFIDNNYPFDKKTTAADEL